MPTLICSAKASTYIRGCQGLNDQPFICSIVSNVLCMVMIPCLEARDFSPNDPSKLVMLAEPMLYTKLQEGLSCQVTWSFLILSIAATMDHTLVHVDYIFILVSPSSTLHLFVPSITHHQEPLGVP